MAQKKNVSVSSEILEPAVLAKKVTSGRSKSAETKAAGAKSAASGKVTAKSSATGSAAKKPAAKSKSKAKSASAAKPVAAPTGAAKATAAKVSPAVKAAASTKSKIAAAAQFVAARRAAAAKTTVQASAAKTPDRPLKAVAAAAPATAKRSSAPVAAAPVEASPEIAAAAKKPAGSRHGFKLHEYIVYPAHGVGQIVGIEEQEIAGMSLELFVITFDKDKMTLRVPTAKVDALRKLSETNVVEKAMQTLKGRARVKRTMWSRRAQEYENKINSGDLIFIAEVVRDLYRSDSQPEQSYSERQLYEAALDRMSRELAAVDNLDERGATQRITDVLSKSAKGRRQAEEDKAAAAEADADDDGVEAA